MITINDSLWSKIKSWFGVGESKPLLSKESAYSIYSIGRNTTMEEVLSCYIRKLFRRIKENASFKEHRMYEYFPEWLCQLHKDEIVKQLKEKGYEVLYVDEEGILISWKIKL